MGREEQLKNIKKIIVRILKKYRIKKAGLFGSYSRGDFGKNSDIDILIQPSSDMSLLDVSGLKIELEEALHNKVDIVTYKYLSPYLKKSILESETRIL